MQTIPEKANRILHIFLICLFLIVFRILFLMVNHKEQAMQFAQHPLLKSVTEEASRGTITDRFGIPLAMNEIQYSAAILFHDIRQIPTIKWIKRKEHTKKVRTYPRKKYIESIASLLGKELHIDPVFIEDTIYSKACIFPFLPFTLKEGLTEQEYYRLKNLERMYPGIVALKTPKRVYPQGESAGNIIGYIGAIGQKEYLSIGTEIHTLRNFLKKREDGFPQPLPKGFKSIREVYDRLQHLERKSYRMNDFVGKMGLEMQYDEYLRGYRGKGQKEFLDPLKKQHLLHVHTPVEHGKQLTTTLSIELQKYAEQLLAEAESRRDQEFKQYGKEHSLVANPWIKGGAIVVLEPNTGEVLTLASYPTMDPNDFISQNSQDKTKHQEFLKALELKSYLGRLWEGKASLEKTICFPSSQQKKKISQRLTWPLYLEHILSKNSPLHTILNSLSNLHLVSELFAELDQIKETFHPTLSFEESIRLLQKEKISEEEFPLLTSVINKILDPRDQLLLFDLLRVCFDPKQFTSPLIQQIGHLSCAEYFSYNQQHAQFEEEVLEHLQEFFYKELFPIWRKQHFLSYLKSKREEEKLKKTYQHPYLEYLNQAKRIQFQHFWQIYKKPIYQLLLGHTPKISIFYEGTELSLSFASFSSLKTLRLPLISLLKTLPSEIAFTCMESFQKFSSLMKPLWGYYPELRKKRSMQTLQDLAIAFYPRSGYGFGRSYAYRQATPLGSLFKIVTGYEALKQYANQQHQTLNPLTIYDDYQPWIQTKLGPILGYSEKGEPIYRFHKGGRLPRSHTRIGRTDFKTAMSQSSNIYFSLLASEILSHPKDLLTASSLFSFGKKTGIDLPYEYAGVLPNDLHMNKTGLYSFAIGQHTLIVTPLQASVMLASIANGGKIYKPTLVQQKQVTSHSQAPDPFLSYWKHLGLSKNPLRPSLSQKQTPNISSSNSPLYEIDLPPRVQRELFTSLNEAVWGIHGSARPTRIRSLYLDPKGHKDYVSLKEQFLGKTATAEYRYRPHLDHSLSSIMSTDIWFGAISFSSPPQFSPLTQKMEWETPELIVVVYLKHGDYGKEAAPLAAKMIQKWRKIQQKHN